MTLVSFISIIYTQTHRERQIYTHMYDVHTYTEHAVVTTVHTYVFNPFSHVRTSPCILLSPSSFSFNVLFPTLFFPILHFYFPFCYISLPLFNYSPFLSLSSSSFFSTSTSPSHTFALPPSSSAFTPSLSSLISHFAFTLSPSILPFFTIFAFTCVQL